MKATEITKAGYYWRFHPHDQVPPFPDWTIVEFAPLAVDGGPLSMFFCGSEEWEEDLTKVDGEFHGPLSHPQQSRSVPRCSVCNKCVSLNEEGKAHAHYSERDGLCNGSYHAPI
jgi:hypothetical protein